MNNAFLSIGSNIGDRETNLSKSIVMVSALEHTSVLLESSNYDSEPLYNKNQGYFLNKVIKIQTKLNPYELLEKVKSIELQMGRDLNNSHNVPRIIDIDILVFNNLVVDSKNLTLPHPRIMERQFVLKPWGEIAPDYLMPGESLTIRALSFKCQTRNQKVKLVKD